MKTDVKYITPIKTDEIVINWRCPVCHEVLRVPLRKALQESESPVGCGLCDVLCELEDTVDRERDESTYRQEQYVHANRL